MLVNPSDKEDGWFHSGSGLCVSSPFPAWPWHITGTTFCARQGTGAPARGWCSGSSSFTRRVPGHCCAPTAPLVPSCPSLHPAAAGWVIFSRDSSCISAAPARPWLCCSCLEPSPGAGVPRLPGPCQAGGGKGKETLLQAKHVFAGLSAIPGRMCSVPLALRSVQLPAALRAPLPFGYP